MRTRIKFCGLTRPDDVDTAVRLGVDAIGLVFDARSRRHVDLATARALRRRLPPFVAAVALFRDAEPAAVDAVIAAVQPDLLQFHGDEAPDACERFGRRYIKAVPMGDGVDPVVYVGRFPSACAALLDSHGSGGLGGSGVAFDWHGVPAALGDWVLAGGLHPGNVAQAITMTRPHAVDVSSGIESAPGIKDAERMRAFIRAVRRADADLSREP